MLIELTEEEVEAVTPVAPTWSQYIQYVGGSQSFGRRLATGLVVCVSLLLVSRLFNEVSFLGFLLFLVGIVAPLYPVLWAPLFTLSRQNLAFREVPYSWLFFGQVKDVFSETVVVEELEKFNEDGDLYVEEVREDRLTLEVGDETGLRFTIETTDEPRYQALVPRQSVLAMVKSYSRKLRQPVLSEVYVVKLGEWVGDVSYLKRDDYLALADDLLEMQ
ncbi:MAG: hypothetical protein AAFY57_05985 [Cyanobacteria bacterium J06642_2]